MQLHEHAPLAPLTTLGVGGTARWLVHAASEPDVRECLRFASEQRLPLFVLGGGSNVLVPDGEFNGLVVHCGLRGIHQDGAKLRAAAGEDWDSLVAQAVNSGMAGIECLSGIPGTVGGTPVQNVGAYGQEVASTIAQVEVIELATGRSVTFPGQDCAFGYRTSRFNQQDRGRYCVTAVTFHLQPEGRPQIRYPELQARLAGETRPTLQQVRDAVLALRRGKGMLLEAADPDCRSAGSFFKNPIVPLEKARELAAQFDQAMPQYPAGQGEVKVSAAWLIERAGFRKGQQSGNAGISSKHTLALVNRGGATAAEMLALRDAIAAEVSRRFGVELQQEPVMLA